MKRILGIAFVVALFALVPAGLWAQGDLTLEGLEERLDALIETMFSIADHFDKRITALEAAVYTPTPAPDPTVIPTATATPIPTNTPTSEPTPTATVAPVSFTVNRDAVNVRAGPGTNNHLPTLAR